MTLLVGKRKQEKGFLEEMEKTLSFGHSSNWSTREMQLRGLLSPQGCSFPQSFGQMFTECLHHSSACKGLGRFKDV